MVSRWLVVALGLTLLTACQDSTNPTAASPSPKVSPSPSGAANLTNPVGVFDGPTLDGKSHVVYLVGVGDYGPPDCRPDCSFAASNTAKVLHTVVAANRALPGLKCYNCEPLVPTISTTRDAVYFLDGTSAIRKMSVDGAVSDVTQIPVSPTQIMGFAVSADDTRIAVAVIDFGASPNTDTVFVETIDGRDKTDVFTSTGGVYYWPVGWHGGSVVLAKGGYEERNQYGAVSLALLDPVQGAQPKPLGTGDCVPMGTLTPSGFACVVRPGTPCLGASVGTTGSTTYYSSCLRRVDWSGKETTFLLTGGQGITDLVAHHAALSPDGHVIATDGLFWVSEPSAAGYPQFQNGFTTSVPFNSMPAAPGIGWVDPHHVAFMFDNTQTGATYQRIYEFSGGYGDFKNVYFQGAASTSFVPGGSVIGALIGTVPGGL